MPARPARSERHITDSGLAKTSATVPAAEKPAAIAAGAGADIHEEVRLAHDGFIMLDDDEGIACSWRPRKATINRPVSRGCRPTVGSSRI